MTLTVGDELRHSDAATAVVYCVVMTDYGIDNDRPIVPYWAANHVHDLENHIHRPASHYSKCCIVYVVHENEHVHDHVEI